jgi:hypothetical protein
VVQDRGIRDRAAVICFYVVGREVNGFGRVGYGQPEGFGFDVCLGDG